MGIDPEPVRTCAHCKHFTIKDHPEHAARGLGHCIGFLESAMDFMGWDDKPCRAYRDASPMEPREKWILQFIKPGEK